MTTMFDFGDYVSEGYLKNLELRASMEGEATYQTKVAKILLEKARIVKEEDGRVSKMCLIGAIVADLVHCDKQIARLEKELKELKNEV